MRHGTWQETGGGGVFPKELLWLAVVIAVMIGVAGAVQAALASVIVWLLVGMLALAAVAGIAGGAWVLHRLKTGLPLLPNMQPLVQFRELDIPQSQPYCLPVASQKALPQVVNHFYGGQHVHGGVDGLPVVRGELISRDGES